MNGVKKQSAMVFGLVLVATQVETATAEAKPFDVIFEDCTEFVGITSVDIENVRERVPTEYTIVGDGSTALVVVRIVDCDAISVDGGRERPGRVTQIGVTIEGDGTADIDNYTLWYGTNLPRLRVKLRSTGMNVGRVRPFVYDVDFDDPDTGALRARAVSRTIPRHVVRATVQAPAADPVPFVARWLDDGGRKTVEMLTSFPDLVFGVAESVLRTPARSALADVLGASTATFEILDSYNAWSTATMVVSVD